MALDKVIDSAQLDANLTAVADAIRTKGGTTGELEFPGGFVSAVEGIQAGGGGDVARSIVNRTITEYNDSSVTYVGGYAFNACTKLVSASCPNVTEIADYGFHNSSSLATIHFPKIVTIGKLAFYNCKITELILPESAKTIGQQAFRYVPLNHIVIPASVTSIGGGNWDKATVKTAGSIGSGCDFEFGWTNSIPNNAFASSKVENIIFPQGVATIGTSAFEGTAITEMVLPNTVTSIGTKCFCNCSMLDKVVISENVESIVAQTFLGAAALKVVVLRSNKMVALGSINAFQSTPFASGGSGGTVYVPSALIAQYQQATNWSTLYAAGTCNFVAIEGSEYE